MNSDEIKVLDIKYNSLGLDIEQKRDRLKAIKQFQKEIAQNKIKHKTKKRKEQLKFKKEFNKLKC